MIPTIKQFNELTQNEKIKLIQQHAPHLLNSLKKSLFSLSPQELSNLFELTNLEVTAKTTVANLTLSLTNFLTNFSTIVEPVIKDLKLSDNEKVLLDSVIKKTLIFAINKASSALYTDLKKGEGVLYNAILSEKTITILEGVLDFKSAIDKNFPGLSDSIISRTSSVILVLASIYSPPLGLALKTSGVLNKVSDFLKTENLNKTVNNMYQSLDKIQQDKTLSQIHKTGVKIANIAEQLGPSKGLNSSTHSLEKFNLSLETSSVVAKEISTNASSKKLLTIVADYAENYVPSSEKEINKKLEAIKKSVLHQLEKSGISKELIAEVNTALDKNIKAAKLEMEKCLDKENKIFDKVGHILVSADILDKFGNQIKEIERKNPNQSQAFKECAQNLKTEIANKIRGDVNKIAKEITVNSPAKEFAKKILGVNLANEILIKRVVTPEKSLGKSPL